MKRSVIESLESRQLLAADLSVAFVSTTLADSLIAGGKNKAANAALTVSNTGDAIVKGTKGNVVVNVGLDDGLGNITPLGTKNVKASALAKSGTANAKVKLAIPTSMAEGTYTLVATVNGGEVVIEDNTANNSATNKSVDVEQANADLTISATSGLSGSVAAGTEGTMTIAVTNAGNVDAKGTGTVQITSTINGTPTVLKTVENVKIKVKPGATVNLKPITFSAQGITDETITATIGASLTSTALNDSADNNAASAGDITVTPPPPSPLAAINVGERVTFKTTQSGGNSTAGFETGNWTDSNGRTGTYYITSGIASDGTCSLTDSNGTPVAGLLFDFNGKTKLGNQTLQFGVAQSESIGSVQVAGSTVYFKRA